MPDKNFEDSSWTEEMDIEAADRVFSSILAPEPEIQSDDAAAFPEFEGYVFEKRLGEGGGGSVFGAVKTGSIRPLAVKVLNHHLVE